MTITEALAIAGSQRKLAKIIGRDVVVVWRMVHRGVWREEFTELVLTHARSKR